MGFFGLTVQHGTKAAPQPRWKHRLDALLACEAVVDVLAVWREVALWPEAPPFSGGVVDWPARLSRGLAVCRAEAAAVRDYMRSQEVSRG